MAAESTTVETLPPRAHMVVCGDCAAVLRQLGCPNDPAVTEIGLNHMCEAHVYLTPERAPLQSTSALVLTPEVLSSWTSVAEGRRDEGAAVRGITAPWLPTIAVPERVGPLTDIAVAIFVAWTKSDQGATASELMVDMCIDYARKILGKTKGA